MDKLKELKKLIVDLEYDFHKFYEKGNAAAGTRVRGGMQKLKAIANAVRTEVQEKKQK